MQTIYTELQSDQFNKKLLESEIGTIKKDKKGDTQQNKPENLRKLQPSLTQGKNKAGHQSTEQDKHKDCI
jgi:hypothetical protein